jgi:transposase
MTELDLFPDLPARAAPTTAEAATPTTSGAPRLVRPQRAQLYLRTCDYDSLLPEDHVARLLWAVVERLDLSAFLARIDARENESGRPAIDPALVISLLLYGRCEGIVNAREIERRCERDDAFRWLCGGVCVNHHLLSDYDSKLHVEVDGLFNQLLAVLLHQGLVSIERTTHDGTRVRASAGAASFRREKTLQDCLQEAQVHLAEVNQQPAPDARTAAARERAARERVDRLQQALAELPKVREAKRSTEEKAEARVSTTDPEARVMKMADGGFRPAYNVQLAADPSSRVVTGVGLTNVGSDSGQTAPMLDDLQRRTGERPAEYLADGGFVNTEAITQAAREGTTVYVPVPAPKKEAVDRYAPKPTDSPEVAAWRARMATPEAKELYKQRASTIELVNADLKGHRGLEQFAVRGTKKVLTSVLWTVLAYNIMQAMKLGAFG